MSNFKTIILAILCIAIVGCNGKRMLLRRDIENFMNTEVYTPPLSNAIFDGKDTLMTHEGMRSNCLGKTEQAFATMAVLFDSTICGSCKVSKIWEYKSIIDNAKASRGMFELMFIFAPTEEKEHDLRIALRGHPFDWSIFIDTEQKFLKANPHIPKNKALHTFLLDKNNHVVLVGDPIGNDKLRGLYMKTIRQLIDNGGVLPEESLGNRNKK